MSLPAEDVRVQFVQLLHNYNLGQRGTQITCCNLSRFWGHRFRHFLLFDWKLFHCFITNSYFTYKGREKEVPDAGRGIFSLPPSGLMTILALIVSLLILLKSMSLILTDFLTWEYFLLQILEHFFYKIDEKSYFFRFYWGFQIGFGYFYLDSFFTVQAKEVIWKSSVSWRSKGR